VALDLVIAGDGHSFEIGFEGGGLQSEAGHGQVVVGVVLELDEACLQGVNRVEHKEGAGLDRVTVCKGLVLADNRGSGAFCKLRPLLEGTTVNGDVVVAMADWDL
jgi:hypothetical protein